MSKPALLLAAAAVSTVAAAQEYPAKRLRLITPVASGSATDILARIVAQKMTERWSQQVIVDNRVGAGSVVGTTLGAQSSADGYTLVMATSSAFAINPSLRANLPYDAIKDFAPISNLAMTPQTLVANPAAEFKSLKDFIAAARDKPGQINLPSGARSSGIRAPRWNEFVVHQTFVWTQNDCVVPAQAGTRVVT